MMLSQYKGTIFLCLIFLASMWAANRGDDNSVQQPLEKSKHSADHFAVNYSKTQMSDLGVAKERLEADYAAHYSDNDETELTKPIMTLYQGLLPPWIVRAQTGIVTSGGEKVFLQGRVAIDRAATESVREVNIKTTNLRIEPKRNYAETDDWAELVSESDRMSGTGMRLVYQDPLYIELLANVKGRHAYE
ncbi:MAG: LPS export ABC transporter periplasmic protein LptC [Methyloprofundus sp.]|nr:LPS export ABC transporter periplasmic protein LptC [Methyloprofundus sp.]MDT8424880.1 LPS export ABC transporter periplasmic protein LptC [Methyloprofundus sp.]